MGYSHIPSYVKAAFVGIAFIKLWLVSAITVAAIGGAGHDDELFVKLASHILQGEWLGSYDHLTLIKGPGYPLWIAFNFLLGLPLPISETLLYLGAGLMFVLAIQHHIKQKAWLIGFYAIYAFNPLVEYLTRVLREDIYPALTVLVIAGLVGLYLRYRETLRNQLRWSLFLGASLSFFWITREEGIWILPLMLLVLAHALWLHYRLSGWSLLFVKKTAILVLPFVMLATTLHGVSWVNYLYYDIYAVVEMKWQPFIAAYGALTRVSHAPREPYLPVPKEVRQRIYAVSPAFKELEPYLEAPDNTWKGGKIVFKEKEKVCRAYPICGDEIYGGWFMWGLRDAVKRAGYYRHQSGAAVGAYYSRLAEEINRACDQGWLECGPPRRTLTPVVSSISIRPMIKSYGKALATLVGLENKNYDIVESSHAFKDNLPFFADLTRSRIAPKWPNTPSDKPSQWPYQERLNEIKRAILKNIGKHYHYVFTVAALVGITGYLITIALSLRKWVITPFLVINTGIFLIILLRLILLALIDTHLFPGIKIRYLVPLYPILFIWVSLIMIDLKQWKET